MESEACGSVVSMRITEKLRKSPSISSEFSIFRVPRQLRRVNEQGYEPQMIAIGPYHHGKADLHHMERHKIHYLRLLLHRTKDAVDHHDDELNRYVSAMKALEERARECYADPIPLDSDDFVEMMLLDGCFLVELIRKCCAMEGLADDHDPIFAVPSNFVAIVRDVLLLENQVPLFVRLNLFQLTKQPNESRDFVSMVGEFVSKKPLGLGFIEIDSEGCYGKMHILSLVHEYWAPPNWRKIPQQDKRLRPGCKPHSLCHKAETSRSRVKKRCGGWRTANLVGCPVQRWDLVHPNNLGRQKTWEPSCRSSWLLHLFRCVLRK
ncbi:unnamed protein product [Linum trigynum]|uniref:Uncharacterized protein n=1 Tax=Linum trigynum TaxID=586398 RepID=A0AAV2F2F1_9ROSI